MADRPVSVTLSANITPYEQAMARAARSMDGLTQSAQKAAAESGKLTANAQQWSTIGGPIAAAGAAMLALSANVAKTGGSYNMLQQTSRAALRTLLGSAEAVNAQMDKLDAFASTSPFSKAVFIQAQQQMLGFGIEAEKVIPYLSAINETTAAVGGNNQTVAELASILAKISSSAKITAQDLNQLGDRGVNAADIIGEQMGKTAGEIRESITRGTLDAEAALDALTTGMSERFEGASANVKETMGGALDRVTAAWRDLSAEMMTPLISPEGGGLLVDAANSLADFLRTIQGMPDGLKLAVGAMGGLTGAAGALGGAFLLMLPRIESTIGAWQTLTVTSPRLTGAISSIVRAAGPWGIALGLVGGAVTIVAGQHMEAKRAAEEYAQALALGGEAGAAAAREIAARELSTKGVAEALRELGVAETLAVDAATGNAEARQKIIDAYDAEVAKLRELADEEFQAGNSSEDYTNQAEQQILTRDQVIDSIDRQADALGRNVESQSAFDALMGKSTAGAEEFAAAMDASNSSVVPQTFLDAAAALGLLSDKILNANQSLRAYADFQLMLEGSVDGLEAAYDKATDAIEKNGKTVDSGTEKGRANRQALRDVVSAANAVTDAMVENGDASEEVAAHIDEARDKYVDFAKGMGDTREESELMREAMIRIPSNIETTFFLPGMLESQEEMHELNRLLQEIPPEKRAEIITIGILDGAEAAKQAIDEVQGKTVTISINAVVGGRGAPLLGRTMYQADGGVVDYYAHGGLRESHVAQIAPAGAWRVWAEPETGGEAYIPLAESKRGRSEQILSEVATRFGMQLYRDGGLNTTQGALSGAHAAPVGSSVTYIDVSSREGLQLLANTLRDSDRIRYKHEGVH